MGKGTTKARATPTTTGPFHFDALPAEVRLQVLESSDLLTPTREVRWDPVAGYKLPSRDGGGRGGWRAPAALFLVSRAFCAQARRVFFRHNRVVVWPHVSAFIGAPEAPVDYAAATFLAGAGAGAALRCLRHLDLRTFPVIGAHRRDAAERARASFFRALRHAYASGGLDGLRFLRVSGFWDEAPARDRFAHDAVAAAAGQKGYFMVLRNFVRDRVWPMIDPECGLPRLPWQLLVEIQGPELDLSRYSIRKKGEQIRDKRKDTERFGEPTASRFISWRPQPHGGWVEEEQDGEWVEEIWIRKLNRP
ncbi:hypothetical protein GGS24DRAFT_228758 [Hypoxylon argillaceum]|nr:hypothetical protein GGS24DRAFT_228758 [Hypoxylon argillaceum]